jgi:hypothetical protein
VRTRIFLISMLVMPLLGTIMSSIYLSLRSYGCHRLQIDFLLTVYYYLNYNYTCTTISIIMIILVHSCGTNR